MEANSKYLKLIAGLISLISAIIILLFFCSFVSDPLQPSKIYIFVKSEYVSIVWSILSLSSILYYYIRSGGRAISGGYINPLFQWFINVAQVVPFFGVLLSLISNSQFLSKNQGWGNLITMSDKFLQVVLIFFILTHLGSGISGVVQYCKRNRI